MDDVGGRPGIVENMMRTPMQRIEILPGAEKQAHSIMGDDMFNQFQTENAGVTSSGLGSAMTVANTALNAYNAYQNFEDEEYMEAAHDAGRMLYPFLMSAGPPGWTAIGVNELLDVLG